MSDTSKTTGPRLGGGWRYQPVYRDDPSGRTVSLCECYFDAHGRLSMWTDDSACHPQGETSEELARDLARMLADTYKWHPVAFDDLHVGMTFEPTGADVEIMLDAMNAARSVKQ